MKFWQLLIGKNCGSLARKILLIAIVGFILFIPIAAHLDTVTMYPVWKNCTGLNISEFGFYLTQCTVEVTAFILGVVVCYIVMTLDRMCNCPLEKKQPPGR